MADERYAFQEVSRKANVTLITHHFVQLKTIKTSVEKADEREISFPNRKCILTDLK